MIEKRLRKERMADEVVKRSEIELSPAEIYQIRYDWT